MVNLSTTLIYSGYICYDESSTNSKKICIQPIYKRASTCYHYILTSKYNWNGSGGYYSSPGSTGLVLSAKIRIDYTSWDCQQYQKLRPTICKNSLNTREPIYTKACWQKIPILVIVDSILHFLSSFCTASHFIKLCRTLSHYSDNAILIFRCNICLRYD